MGGKASSEKDGYRDAMEPGLLQTNNSSLLNESNPFKNVTHPGTSGKINQLGEIDGTFEGMDDGKLGEDERKNE